jgi:TPP-dependent pyruvate/acetoin dehydrogenase alpha subunit
VGDPLTYRTKEEAEEVKQNRDPLDLFEQRVVEAGVVDADALRAIDGDVTAEIDDAVAWAEGSPFPTDEDVLRDVYVDG